MPEFVVPGEDDASVFPEYYEEGKPKKTYKIKFYGSREVLAINEQRAREEFYAAPLEVIQETEIESITQTYPPIETE